MWKLDEPSLHRFLVRFPKEFATRFQGRRTMPIVATCGITGSTSDLTTMETSVLVLPRGEIKPVSGVRSLDQETDCSGIENNCSISQTQRCPTPGANPRRQIRSSNLRRCQRQSTTDALSHILFAHVGHITRRTKRTKATPRRNGTSKALRPMKPTQFRGFRICGRSHRPTGVSIGCRSSYTRGIAGGRQVGTESIGGL